MRTSGATRAPWAPVPAPGPNLPTSRAGSAERSGLKFLAPPTLPDKLLLSRHLADDLPSGRHLVPAVWLHLDRQSEAAMPSSAAQRMFARSVSLSLRHGDFGLRSCPHEARRKSSSQPRLLDSTCGGQLLIVPRCCDSCHWQRSRSALSSD